MAHYMQKRNGIHEMISLRSNLF